MNAPARIEAPALAKLREPFPANQISKLPKESRKQIDERKNRAPGCMVWECKECGNAHHKDAVHLDYVGHAALTDRLLDTDPEWSWEPVAFGPDGLPAFDRNGGLWIRLTVLGVTRLGYGDAEGKSGGNAVKEAIGDALRNAAMRFGAALDLWHKGDLHADDEPEEDHWAKMVQLAEATGTSSQELATHLKVRSLKNLTPEQYKQAFKFLDERMAEKVKGESNKSLADELDDSIAF